MKPEVAKIFDDLDAWREHCRFNGIKFDEADLYKSRAWKEFAATDTNKTKSFKPRSTKPRKEKNT